MTDNSRSTRVYRRYFAGRLEEFGGHIEALDYGSALSQRRKFEVIANGIRPSSKAFSLLDVGCGFGDFYGYLRKQGLPLGRYLGLDLLPGMVSVAQKRYPRARFRTADVLREGIPGRFDYVAANGIFYLRTPSNREYLRRMVRIMWDQCRTAVLFNARSRYADTALVKRERHLYQYDPADVLAFCMGLTRTVVLRHDYMPHEFTVYLYRGST